MKDEREPPHATADTRTTKEVTIPSRMTNATPESLREARVSASTKYQQERAKAGLPPRYM